MFKNGMRPIHPGEVLREDFLKPLGMTAHALSKALHVTPARINDIVNENAASRQRLRFAWPGTLAVILCPGSTFSLRMT